MGSPWGTRQPEPYFDRAIEIFHVALRQGLRSPFKVDDELKAAGEDRSGTDERRESLDEADQMVEPIQIDVDGLLQRVDFVARAAERGAADRSRVRNLLKLPRPPYPSSRR